MSSLLSHFVQLFCFEGRGFENHHPVMCAPVKLRLETSSEIDEEETDGFSLPLFISPAKVASSHTPVSR